MVNKRFWLGILVMALVFGMTVVGCDNGSTDNDGNGNDNNGNNTTITFNNVIANGSSSQTTTQVTLTFSQVITGLSVSDITLSGIAGVVKGTLSNSDVNYTLPISGFSTGGILSVTVAKSGYTINGSPKTVTIFYNAGNTDPKTITITGITKSGEASLFIGDLSGGNDEIIAKGTGNIINSSVTFSLIDQKSKSSWTGSGSFLIIIEVKEIVGGYDEDVQYFYTNGKSTAELGISSTDSESTAFSKLPTYNISSQTSTIAFNLFRDINSELWQ